MPGTGAAASRVGGHNLSLLQVFSQSQRPLQSPPPLLCELSLDLYDAYRVRWTVVSLLFMIK